MWFLQHKYFLQKKIQWLDQVHFKKIYNDWINWHLWFFFAYLKKIATTGSRHFLSPDGQGSNFIFANRWQFLPNQMWQNRKIGFNFEPRFSMTRAFLSFFAASGGVSGCQVPTSSDWQLLKLQFSPLLADWPVAMMEGTAER